MAQCLADQAGLIIGLDVSCGTKISLSLLTCSELFILFLFFFFFFFFHLYSLFRPSFWQVSAQLVWDSNLTMCNSNPWHWQTIETRTLWARAVTILVVIKISRQESETDLRGTYSTILEWGLLSAFGALCLTSFIIIIMASPHPLTPPPPHTHTHRHAFPFKAYHKNFLKI